MSKEMREQIDRIKSFGKFLNENTYTNNQNIKSGDVIEVVTIFGRGKDELKDIEKKYIGRLYVVDSIEDNEALRVLGGGSWMFNDVRKLTDSEIKQRQKEIDKIYSDIEDDKVYRRNQNREWLKNHINTFKQYLSDKEFDFNENDFDLSNDKYEITLSIKKRG
jgi:hypothetical protein